MFEKLNSNSSGANKPHNCFYKHLDTRTQNLPCLAALPGVIPLQHSQTPVHRCSPVRSTNWQLQGHDGASPGTQVTKQDAALTWSRFLCMATAIGFCRGSKDQVTEVSSLGLARGMWAESLGLSRASVYRRAAICALQSELPTSPRASS